MGVLNPLFLVAGLAVAVPLILHLFHRHEAKRVVFPAIQYLLRTEKEHARTIRFRQLLLLLLRTTALLFIVLIGARPFLRGGGGIHEPTALVIVLDNSMSSGLVIDEGRVLERLKASALESLERVGTEDRVWLLRAGEPWAPALQGMPEELALAVRQTDVSAAGGNLHDALARARSLVEQSGLELREIHLISDAQADPDGGTFDTGSVSVVVFAADAVAGENVHLDSLTVGGGLAPLANEGSQLAVRVDGADASVVRPLRLVVNGRIRGVVSGVGGATAVLPFGPFTSGWITGFVETDPDALAADDRRYFAVAVRPTPSVGTGGRRSFFLDNALPVLESAGRIRLAASGEVPDVVVALGGAGLDGSATPTVVFPEGDATTLPALNRRLAAAGIAWRYEMAADLGEAGVETSAALPVDMSATRVRTHYQLTPNGAADQTMILARLSSGEPWIVEASTNGGRALLIGSPIEEDATSLPVTAVMIPLLDWTLGSWSARLGRATGLPAGSAIPLTVETTDVVDPMGTVHPAESGRAFEATRWAGVYDLMSGDRIVSRIAVNPPTSESSMTAMDQNSFRSSAGGSVTFVRNRDRWAQGIFVDSQGPEIGGELLVVVLLLMLAESLLAAAGTTKRSARSAQPTPSDVSTAEV